MISLDWEAAAQDSRHMGLASPAAATTAMISCSLISSLLMAFLEKAPDKPAN